MAIPPGDYAHFHYFESGGGWLHLEGQPEAIAVSSGELLVLPRGRGHSLSDTPGRPAVPLRYLLAGSQADGRCSLLRHGGGGPETRIICGSFSFAVPDGLPLLALLPELLRLRGDGASRGWLEPTLRMLADEARRRRAGGTIVTSRLTDVLFVQVVRAWLEAQPAPAGNWLAALRDPRIGAALARIHGRPEHPWSVAELAAEVGMSRSPFAYRFAALAGEPPLAYLARWRAQVAARLLRETSLALGAVAARVGYESEAAFSRAFRRAMGVAPGAYRRARRAA
jgi:AraC-like DNA-binding protein